MLSLVGEIYREESSMLFQAGPLKMSCIDSDKHLAKSADIHSSIHTSSYSFLIHHPLFPQGLPTCHLPQVQCDVSDPLLQIILHSIAPYRPLTCGRPLNYWTMIISTLSEKQLCLSPYGTRDWRQTTEPFELTLHCSDAIDRGWFSDGRASFHIQFYKAHNTKPLSLCLTGRVIQYKLNFSPGDETQWAGIWGKR